MTASQYAMLRRVLGTQAEVAAKLGIHRVTVAKREAGTLTISEEASLAILSLAGAVVRALIEDGYDEAKAQSGESSDSAEGRP
jgi:DNA-binding XRE family transcriptional regulator